MTLRDMVDPQPSTEIINDNSMAYGIMKRIIKHKLTESMDMRFYWVCDQAEQKCFDVKWKPVHMNLGDYFTNHHPPTHHRSIRQTYPLNTTI